MGFLIFSALFAVFAVVNVVNGEYAEAAAGFAIALVLLGIYKLRLKKAEEFEKLLAENKEYPCARCNSKHGVNLRAYFVCYSLVFFTSKSLSSVKPICDSCKVKAGLPHSFITFLAGWWGIPYGPIYTVQSIYRNFKGGVLAKVFTFFWRLFSDHILLAVSSLA